KLWAITSDTKGYESTKICLCGDSSNTQNYYYIFRGRQMCLSILIPRFESNLLKIVTWIVKLVFVTSLLGAPMIFLEAEAHINNNNNNNSSSSTSQPVISQVANTSRSNDAGA